MKLARLLAASLCSASLLTSVGCASSAHPRKGARSRATCEQLLHHSFQLQLNLASLALDDHDFQRRTLEAQLRQREEELKNGPTFLESCNNLTEAEYSCMSNAEDWYTYQSCYAAPASSTSNDAAPAPPDPSADDAAGDASPEIIILDPAANPDAPR